MVVYHGSQNIIRVPQYGLGSKSNDYGRGFYCTEDLDLAKEWACIRGTDGYANKYRLKTTGLTIIDLCSPEFSILNWLALLAKNRSYWEKNSISEEAKDYLQENFYPDVNDADILIGYRADDSYFTFAKNFVANTISLEQLSLAMQLGDLGQQIVLVSKKAFKQIVFIDAIESDSIIYAEKAQKRDQKARKDYQKMVRSGSMKNGTYMVDIIREGLTNGDFL